LEARGYIICTTPRSGSSYLCALLRSTNVLGQPREYFHASTGQDPELQLEQVVQSAATPNRVYGLKAFPDQFDRMVTTTWSRRLPPLAAVFLRRRSLLSQGLSYAKARQTGEWVASETTATDPVFDAGHVTRLMMEIARGEAQWRFYFASRGIEALELFYEDVVASPQVAVDAVADLVGLPERPLIDAGQIGLKVQRDERSEAWRTQFLAAVKDAADGFRR
jgi:trehalose 2-sulfotransferase